MISWKRSRRRSAFSSPFSFGIRTETATSSGGSMRSRTSSASASCGITSARTKLVTSSRRTPVRASRSISRTFSSVGTISGSFWKPSRGPTSRMRTRSGVIASRNLYSGAVSSPVVLLAGGTGGAKLARGMLDEVGERARRDRQHRRRRRGARRLRLARPRPRPLLAGRPHRRARLGPARRHLRGDGRAARARRGRLVQPRRPRPRGLPPARAAARRGRADDRDARGAGAGARRARRACCRPPTRPSARTSAPAATGSASRSS